MCQQFQNHYIVAIRISAYSMSSIINDEIIIIKKKTTNTLDWVDNITVNSLQADLRLDSLSSRRKIVD